MDNFNKIKSELTQLISESSGIGIIVSSNQTVDVLAAAISLHLILQDSGKNSQIASQKNPTVEHSFLVGIDQLKNNFSGLTRMLTVSFPYHDGDIEKVSYNIEGDRLNVNLFAEEQGIGFTEKDIRYIKQGSSPNLIITVGILQASEIEYLVGQGAKIINIDNSVSNLMFGQVNIVDVSYSSLSELVAKIANELQFVIEFDVAQNLLDGIASATNNFMSPKTSPLAFEMAGFLMQKGAIRKDTKEVQTHKDESLEMLGKKNK
jgi:nanoRNase/pAp phosphatase (c-di-AMP/oligoRNAs hydrolase)